jgi:hypothetical protein
MSIALCLQAYPGDLDAAMDLAKLICEIEPVVRDTEFVLVYRKDCDIRCHKHFETLAGMRFARAYARMARNHEVGWAGGPNMLAHSAFMEMNILAQGGEVLSDGFLLFEPDCIPLTANWIDQLSAEWEKTKELGKEAFGHWHQQHDPSTLHMNGNAVFATRFFDAHNNIMIGPSTMGWDWFYRERYIELSRDSDLIYQHYNRHGMTQGEWEILAKNGVRPAFFHGIKTDHGRALARANLVVSAS